MGGVGGTTSLPAQFHPNFHDWRRAGECAAGSPPPENQPPQNLCVQNDLPALTEFDKHAMAALCSEFEVDFMTLSYARSQEDVFEAREFLESIGREGIKVGACAFAATGSFCWEGGWGWEGQPGGRV